MCRADAAVLAISVYFDSMSGQVEPPDPTVAFPAVPSWWAKKLIIAAAAGKGVMKCTIDGLRGFANCLSNLKVKGVIYGAGAPGLCREIPQCRKADQAGRNVG